MLQCFLCVASYHNFFQGVQQGYCATFLLTVSHDVIPIINNIQRDKIHKKFIYVLNQNVQTSIAGNLCLLQQYKWNTIKIRYRD